MERPLVIVERLLIFVERPLVIVERLLIFMERLLLLLLFRQKCLAVRN